MSALTIIMPLPERALCGNGPAPASKGGKIARGKVIALQREHARLAVFSALADYPETLRGPLFPAGVRVRLSAIVRRSPRWSARRLDDDNYWRGAKSQIDALADAGAIHNDAQIELGAVAWETAAPGEQGATWHLTEVE
jgi:hypothetical protein